MAIEPSTLGVNLFLVLSVNGTIMLTLVEHSAGKLESTVLTSMLRRTVSRVLTGLGPQKLLN